MSAAAPLPTAKIAPMDKFLACVHCGLCLSACPTYLETGAEADSPRGRIYLMKALEEGTLAPAAGVVRHLDLCLGCRACETACPSGVEYGLLIEGARRHLAPARRGFERWWRRGLGRVLPEPYRLAPFVALVRFAARLRVPRLATAGWLPNRLRRLAALVPEARAVRALPALLEPAGAPLGTAALLSGCVTQAAFSHLNVSSARLLAAAGYRVIVPRGQVCCGALSAHLGEKADAVRLARRNVNAFLRDEPDWIVTSAAGCGAMMREYDRWTGGDSLYSGASRTVAAKVRDVTELLAAGSLPAAKHELRARVAYHDACHLAHGQGVRREPRALLRAIPGLELVEIAESEVCCGSAGSYNLTEPDMAWRLGARKARAVLASGADLVAAGNPGCILQIRAALRLAGRDLPVLHPVELLARAYLDEP